MNIFTRIVRALNTTRVGKIGLGTAIASAVTLLGQGVARGFVASTLAPRLGPGAAIAADNMIDTAVAGASGVLIPAIGAAFVGMPPGVSEPAKPSSP